MAPRHLAVNAPSHRVVTPTDSATAILDLTVKPLHCVMLSNMVNAFTTQCERTLASRPYVALSGCAIW